MPPLMTSTSLELNTASFKQRKRLDSRIHEVNRVKSRYPCKLPVIVERSHREKLLPPLQKIKFLVPPEVTMGQFVSMIRCRLSLPPSHSLCIIVNGRQMASLSMTMLEVYAEHRDQDGFLYVTYRSHEVFG
ncbi:microtubule-associated proteins 1A/1B light chain 3C-like [Bufo gargarizans]|uniref:microtubule-associated proteins 1A/1B light chain 3C-like n=1 Tax=Bufo gargarizans TaxID=30331 RepID=UPI001CF1DA21|nr:microtubule-associated proteins 1A/1B light chain 3C-like [Bufo gargarizans]